MALGQRERGLRASVQTHIPNVDRRERFRRATRARIRAGDHPQAPRAIGQLNRRNLAIHQRLIARRAHLILRRQIHPKLHHLHRTAVLGERRRVKLFVQNARRRRHPLHIARPDMAAITSRVAVIDLAGIDNRHRLKPTMRMHAHAPLPRRRRKFGRRCVVEQNERRQQRAMRLRRKHRAHRKAVAHPMRARRVLNDNKLSHYGTPPRQKYEGLRPTQ